MDGMTHGNEGEGHYIMFILLVPTLSCRGKVIGRQKGGKGGNG